MLCNQCEKHFDLERHVPKLLPKCGHSICASCLAKLCATSFPEFKCPFDNLLYAKSLEFNDNLFLLEQLGRAGGGSGKCGRHGKELDIFCGSCAAVICSDCALFEGHKQHGVESLGAAQARSEEKLRRYRGKIAELQGALLSESRDLGEAIAATKREKLEFIERNFRELAAALEEYKAKTVKSIADFYDNVHGSFTLFRNKVQELDAKINAAKSERELLMNPGFEREFLRDMRELDELISSKSVFSEIEQHRQLLDVSFDRNFAKNLSSFCKISCQTFMNQTGKTSFQNESKAFYDQIKNDENLLHESFKELMKNAAISLMNDDHPNPDDSRRTKTFFHASPRPAPPNVFDARNFSPLSGLSGVSASKQPGPGPAPRFDERSLLSRKKESRSLLNYGAINPFTTKKSMNSISENEPPLKPAESNVTVPPRASKLSDCASMKSTTSTNKPDPLFGNKENLRDFPGNANSRPGAERLGQLLELAARGKLDTLDLTNFGLDDKSVEGLGKRLAAMRQVRTLKLNGNAITEIGLKAVLKNIKELAVEYIFMTHNNLKDTALDYLISFRKYNGHLKAVYLAGNPLNKASSRLKMKMKLLEESNITVVL